MNLNARLARACSELLRGMLYPGSEGDSSYTAFHAEHPDAPVTAESFRSAAVAHLADWWEVDARSGSAELAVLVDGAEGYDQFAYELLRTLLLEASSDDPHHVVVTARPSLEFHPTRHYVFAQLPEGGGLAGILTLSVET